MLHRFAVEILRGQNALVLGGQFGQGGSDQGGQFRGGQHFGRGDALPFEAAENLTVAIRQPIAGSAQAIMAFFLAIVQGDMTAPMPHNHSHSEPREAS